MKIARRDNDQLVLTDLGASIRGVGAFVMGFGALWIFAGNQGRAPAAVPLVIGTIAIAAGLALIILPGRVTAVFTLSSRTLVITRRSLRGRTEDEIDLAKIASVETESSTGTRGTVTWRVTVVLKDGTRIPLTSYYSNSSTHAAAAQAAREFLSLPEPALPPPPDPLAAALAAQPALASALKGVPFIFSIFCAAFLAFGGWIFYQQAQLLSVARQAPAVILSRGTEMQRGSKGSVTWRPVVSYRYSVRDTEYISSRVTPLNESRSAQWADRLIERFPVGSTTAAWYDPKRPANAFLVHEWSLLPLFFTLFPLAMLLFASVIYRRIQRARATAQGLPPS